MSGAQNMARVSRKSANAGAGGQVVSGAYAALLEYERERYYGRGDVTVIDGRELRVVWVDRDDHSKGFFLWPPRRELDRLEAGESVVVECGRLALALWDRDGERDSSMPRVRLPFDRGVKRVRVSPDDQVVPAAKDRS
jgi:hypothetical protein